MLKRIRYIVLTFGIIFITADIAFALQYARPNGIVSSSGWSPVGASTIWEATDEPSPADDNDYMIATGDATGELQLSDVTDPGVDTGHTFSFRATSTGSGGPEKFNVRLLDGTTEIDVHNNLSSRGSYTTFSYALDPVDVANISDYSNLRVEFSTTSVGNGEDIRISWIELELPDAAASTEPTVTTGSATSIDTTTATLGGNVTDTGGDDVTERGAYWSTSSGFTPPGEGTPDSTTGGPWGTGAFTELVGETIALPAGSQVYFISFAANTPGEGYGSEASFFTEPLQASTIGFENITDTGMRITWTAGTGGATVNSMVIVRQVGAVDFAPVDGSTYTANADFESGTPLGPTNDNYVVFNAAGTQVDVTGLSPSTLYYVAVYAHVGSGSLINYQQDGQPTDSQITNGSTSAPTVTSQPATIIDTTSARLWATITDDGGDPPITSRGTVWDTSPTPRLNLLAQGDTGMGSFSHDRSGLYEGTLIYFAGYATNGTDTGYSSDGSFYTEPLQASTIGFENVADTAMRITWTAGTSDGTYGETVNSIVIVKQGSVVTQSPADGDDSYSAGTSAYNDGTELGGASEYVVFNGVGTQVDITGLLASTTYHVAVYAHVGTSSLINYQQDSAPAASRQTNAAAVLATLSSTLTLAAIETTSATLGATITDNGGGAILERGTVWDRTSSPTANAVDEGGTSVDSYTHGRTGLYEGTLIYYRGYADNSAGRAYSPAPGDSFYTEPGQATSVGFENVLAEEMRITWTTGTSHATEGATVNHIVIVKQGGIVTQAPADGPTTYDPGTSVLNDGTELGGASEYVVFNGTGTQVDITGLIAANTYYVAVYAYVGSGAATNYQQDGAATGTQPTTGGGPVPPTLSAPTVTLATVTTTTATLGATVDTNGGDPVSERGTVWDVLSEPNTTDNKTIQGSGLGDFTHSVSSLYEGTLIYYRGYASNSTETGYSPEDSFYTEPLQATGVTFAYATHMHMGVDWTPGTSDATYGAEVKALIVVRQGSAVTQAPVDGVVYTGAPFGSGTDLGGGEYVIYSGPWPTVPPATSIGVTGLVANTTYHVAVYAYVGSGSMTNYQQDSPAVGNETTGPPSHNAAHGITGCSTCHAMHSSGFVPRNDEQVTACMDVCHKDGGPATNKKDVALHTADGGSTIVDCGSCHDVHAYDFRTTDTDHGGGTALNLSRIRWDTDKFMGGPGADIALEEAVFQQRPAHFAFDETTYPSGPYNGICQTCHTRVTKHTNDGWDDDAGAAADNDHEKGSDCIGCHSHLGNFAGAGGGCTTCHDKIQDEDTEDGIPARRAIVGASGDFILASHHVVGGTPTDEDCAVCHMESEAEYHKNSGLIDLRNPDTGGAIPGFVQFSRANDDDFSDEPWVTNVQDFHCMKCHDALGATGTDVPVEGGTALQPFSSNTRNAPNVFDQFATSHTFFHPVRGVANNPICDSVTMESPWNQGDHDLISCFDCHDVNGHGSDNQRMLRTAIDFDQMEVAGASGDKGDLTGTGIGLTVEAFCVVCHKSTVYVDNGSGNSVDLGSIFESHGKGQGQHGGAGGNELGCLGCHGGLVNLGELPNDNGAARGNIHGASFDWSTTTSYASTPTDIFMLGGWIGGWDIDGSTGQCTGGECQHSGTKNPRQNYTQAID